MLAQSHVNILRNQYVRMFPHLCRIYRRAVNPTPNPYEETEYLDHAPLPGDPVPCWLAGRRGGGEDVVDRRVTMRYEHELQLPIGTDITEDDAVGDVVRRTNPSESIHSGLLYVDEIVRLRRSLLLTLKERRA